MSKSRTDQNDQTKDGWLHTLHTLHNQNHHRAELKSIDDFWANCTNWRHFSSFTVVQWHSFTTLFILAFLPYLIDTFLWSLFFPLPIPLPHYPLPRPPPQPLFQHIHTQSITGLLCSSTLTKTHRDEQEPIGAVLPTQQVSSVGSRVPGLSQGVGLRLRQPLPCPHCYCTGSSVHIVSTQTVRKTGNWRNADAAGESRCNRHRDPFTWINIVLPAAARLTKQKEPADYYTQQSFIWVVVGFDKWTSFFFFPTTCEKRVIFFRRGATNIAPVALARKLLLPSSGNFWSLHLIQSTSICNCIQGCGGRWSLGQRWQKCSQSVLK